MWMNCMFYLKDKDRLNYKWNLALYYVHMTSETQGYRKIERMKNNIQGIYIHAYIYTYQEKEWLLI